MPKLQIPEMTDTELLDWLAEHFSPNPRFHYGKIEALLDMQSPNMTFRECIKATIADQRAEVTDS